MTENTHENPAKICLECGEPLGPGREDKKFCNDSCRTSFNNRRRKEPVPHGETDTGAVSVEENMARVNSILRRNREIIFDLVMNQHLTSMYKHDLIGYGFNFKFITSTYDDPEAGYYRFCYEWGYRFDGPDRVEFIPRMEEIRC
jgi:hypothetical protein